MYAIRLLLLSALLMIGLPAVPAWAGNCNTPYTGAQLLNDVQVMQFAMRNEDDASFAVAAGRMEAGLPCLNTAISAQVFATTYRFMGVWYIKKGDTNLARRWFRSAVELEPTYEFSAADLEMGDPIRALFEEERQNIVTKPTPIEGMSLNVPAGSTLTLDGRPLVTPAATLDRFHVIQQIGSDKAVRAVWLISGNEFPEVLLRAQVASAPVETKKPKNPPASGGNTATTGSGSNSAQPRAVVRTRPAEKTPLLIAGGTALLGAGALYGVAMLQERQFHPASMEELTFQTPDEVDAAGSTINALIMGAGGLAAVGLGIGYWGIIIDDGGLGVRFAAPF